MQIKIISYNDRDKLEKIQEEEKEIFKKTAFDMEVLNNIVRNPRCKIITAEDGEKIVAHAITLDVIDGVELLKIAVSKSHRLCGIGKELLDEIKKTYKKTIFLEVRETNIAAQEFYRKQKFIKISERKRYYTDTGENAYIMMYESK